MEGVSSPASEPCPPLPDREVPTRGRFLPRPEPAPWPASTERSTPCPDSTKPSPAPPRRDTSCEPFRRTGSSPPATSFPNTRCPATPPVFARPGSRDRTRRRPGRGPCRARHVRSAGRWFKARSNHPWLLVPTTHPSLAPGPSPDPTSPAPDGEGHSRSVGLMGARVGCAEARDVVPDPFQRLLVVVTRPGCRADDVRRDISGARPSNGPRPATASFALRCPVATTRKS